MPGSTLSTLAQRDAVAWPAASLAIITAATAIGAASVRSPLLATAAVGAFGVIATLGVERAGLVFTGAGFGLGAAVSDSTIAPALASAQGGISLNPTKLGPYLLLLLGASLLILGTARSATVNRPQLLLGGYLVFAFIGVIGSATPQFAALRWVQGALPVVCGVLVYRSRGRSPWLVTAVLGGALWNVLAACYLGPRQEGVSTPFSSVDRFSGFVHPDLLSIMAACIIAVAFWALVAKGRTAVLWALPLLGVAVFAMSLAVGRTGFIAAIAMIAVVLLQRPSSRESRRTGSSRLPRRLALAGVIIIVSYTQVTEIAAWFIRGETSDLRSLTGRTTLWETVWPYIAERPLFGWGPGALRAGPISAQVEHAFGNSGHAHNALVESALSAGLIGAAIWVAAVLILGWMLFKDQGTLNSIVLFRALWVGLALMSVAESQTAGFGFGWYLLVALTCVVAPPRLGRSRDIA